MLNFFIRRGTELVFCDQADRERFGVSLLRTLRLPDDGVRYPLPPGMGPLPLRDVTSLAGRVPPAWLSVPGVVVPMYRCEAMWILFSSDQPLPHAVKVGCGGINVLSGRPLSRKLEGPVRPGLWRRMLGAAPAQDYAVCPPQQFIDGFNTGHHSVRQFVAVPLGEGKTVEAQLTGQEKHGGIQLCVYPPRRERAAALSRAARPVLSELVPVAVEGSEADAETPAWEWAGPGEAEMPVIPPPPPPPAPVLPSMSPSEPSAALDDVQSVSMSLEGDLGGSSLAVGGGSLASRSSDADLDEMPVDSSKLSSPYPEPDSPSIAGAWADGVATEEKLGEALDLADAPVDVTLRGYVAGPGPGSSAVPAGAPFGPPPRLSALGDSGVEPDAAETTRMPEAWVPADASPMPMPAPSPKPAMPVPGAPMRPAGGPPMPMPAPPPPPEPTFGPPTPGSAPPIAFAGGPPVQKPGSPAMPAPAPSPIVAPGAPGMPKGGPPAMPAPAAPNPARPEVPAPAPREISAPAPQMAPRAGRSAAKPSAAAKESLDAAPAAPAPELMAQAAAPMKKEKAVSGGALVQPAVDRPMGLGAGGQISQTIYADPYGIETWDEAACTELFIHIVSPRTWYAMTGEPPPPTPISFRAYQAAGLPWFQIYDEEQAGIAPSPELKHVRSVDELDRRK